MFRNFHQVTYFWKDFNHIIHKIKILTKMSKRNILLIVSAIFLFIAFSWVKSKNNNMVTLDENTIKEWANVEVQYQRRSDLIPNLVNVVKGYASHEKEVLTEVTQARANASSININADNLTPENIQKFQAAQNQLSGSLSKLLLTVERYPDLKANQNFLELQAQLEGTENRIAVQRARFNESVQEFNTYIRLFPNSIFAKWFNFERKGLFEADKGAEKAPEVTF